MPCTIDWRLPQYRREAFLRFYRFHLEYKSHPGAVYSMLPAVAKAFNLDANQRAWLTWLNGNTQNIVTSLLLLQAGPTATDWRGAVDFYHENYAKLEWDTDRRHQKPKFAEATEQWISLYGRNPAFHWKTAGRRGWKETWAFATSQPYMGRLSSWSMIEYARILFGKDIIPDADTWILDDLSGSKSHRNGIALVKGYESTYWEAGEAKRLGIVRELEDFADGLLAEVNHPDASRLTMESALCTYKSWHKPNRRYPNVYSDMLYYRLKRAEAHFGQQFDVLWQARQDDLPKYLRLEHMQNDPGLARVKQNHYLETGCPVMLHRVYPGDMDDGFMQGFTTPRRDPKWGR